MKTRPLARKSAKAAALRGLSLALLVGSLAPSQSSAQCIPRGTIACGDAPLHDTIAMAGTCNSYDLHFNTPGAIAIRLDDTGGLPGWNPHWTLFFGSSFVASAGAWLEAPVIIPLAGDYRLEIADPQGNGVGNYAVQVRGVSPDLACGGTISCGADGQTIEIQEPFVMRTVSFDVSEPGSVYLSPGNLTGTSFDPFWELHDPTGQLVGGATRNPAARQCSLPGRYTVLLWDSSNGTGTVSLGLDGVSESLSCGHGMACGPQGTTASFSTQEYGDFTDSYRLDVLTSGEVTISVVALSGGATPRWDLFAPDGSFVYNWCGTRTVNLTMAGVHTLVVSDCSLNGDATYRLTVEPSGAAPAVCGAPIATRVTDNPGQRNPAFFTVSGVPHLGGTVTFDVNGSANGHSASALLARRREFMLTLAGGQVLLVDPTAAQALASPVGTPDLHWTASVPMDPNLLGVRVYTQGVSFGGGPPFELSNRVTLTVGQ